MHRKPRGCFVFRCFSVFTPSVSRLVLIFHCGGGGAASQGTGLSTGTNWAFSVSSQDLTSGHKPIEPMNVRAGPQPRDALWSVGP